MTGVDHRITAEELSAMGDIGRCELVRGAIVHMPLASAEHGAIAGEIGGLIWTYVQARRLGNAYAAGTGFTIARDPDTVRAPDVAFVRKARVSSHAKKGFFDGCPDLAVEVVSPDDLASEVTDKVEQWLAAGTTSVWVVDPGTRTIDVYHSGAAVTRFRNHDELRDDSMLPGFVLNLANLFGPSSKDF